MQRSCENKRAFVTFKTVSTVTDFGRRRAAVQRPNVPRLRAFFPRDRVENEKIGARYKTRLGVKRAETKPISVLFHKYFSTETPWRS